jgi:hypothetical protein
MQLRALCNVQIAWSMLCFVLQHSITEHEYVVYGSRRGTDGSTMAMDKLENVYCGGVLCTLGVCFAKTYSRYKICNVIRIRPAGTIRENVGSDCCKACGVDSSRVVGPLFYPHSHLVSASTCPWCVGNLVPSTCSVLVNEERSGRTVLTLGASEAQVDLQYQSQ